MKKIISICVSLCLFANFIAMPVFASQVDHISNIRSKQEGNSYYTDWGDGIRLQFEYRDDGSIIGKQFNYSKLVGETKITPNSGSIESVEYLENGAKKEKIIRIPKTFNKKNFHLSSSYSFNGKVHYKPYYDPYLGEIKDSLSTYSKINYEDDESYTIKGEKGDFLLDVVSLVIGFLTGFGIGDSIADKTANALIGSVVSFLGVKIVEGKIETSFTQKVSARATHYDLKVMNPNTDVTKYFSGSRYVVKTEKSDYYNETFYEDYYPQFISERDNAVAYWLFSEFFAYNYPGVRW